MLYFILFAAVNVAGSAMFYADKRKAVKRKPRISEKTLLIWAFFGAAISMMAVSKIIRHKTRVWKFKLLLPLFITLHAAVFFFIC